MSTDTDDNNEAIEDIAYKLKTMIAREEEDASRAPKQSAAAMRVLLELDDFVEKIIKGNQKR